MGRTVLRIAIFVHRWLGVALAVLFAVWFMSGIVMMYWSFPELTVEDRLQRSITLAPESIRFSPEDAYAMLGRDGPPAAIRLTSFDGRPVYEFSGGGRGGRRGRTTVFADDGSIRADADEAMVDRAATQWAGRPLSAAVKTSVTDIDQWTVAGQLRSLRPMFKYSFDDGQQVYVNGRTADVVQYTTTSSRFWAWLGAIPHWLYFTALRRNQAQWFSFVVYSSLVGTIAALLGVAIAVWMFSPRRRYRYAGAPTSIPYRGWKRWHTIIGLIFGVVATTWAFSGLLSMGPFPIMDTLTSVTVPDDPPAATESPDIGGALRGRPVPLAAYAARTPQQALAAIRAFQPKELEFMTFVGKPVYLAVNASGATRVVPVDGSPSDSFDLAQVSDVVRRAAGSSLSELKVIDQYDAYYLDRHREAPLPVVYVRLNDAAATRYYVDPKTATVVGSYSNREWISRWLYHGLHSLDFPWLYNYRPLWDIVVITLMLGGTALCMTSLVLAWNVLARKMLRVFAPDKGAATDNLALEN